MPRNFDVHQAEIKTIHDETYDDVKAWFENAIRLDEDARRSRRMADDIEAEAQAPQASGEALREAEQKVEFLAREMNFKERLKHSLESLKSIGELLDHAEDAGSDRRILHSLLLLEGKHRC